MQKLNPTDETAKITFSLPASLKESMLSEVERRTGNKGKMSEVYRLFTEKYINKGIDAINEI